MTPGTDPAPMQASEFEAMAAVEDRHWWFRGKREIVTHLLRKAGVKGKILDAGCGTGGNLPALEEFGEAVGVEKDPVALEFARNKHGGQVFQGEMTSLPFQDGEFDGIITTDVLEHVSDDRKSLSELVRVLKPGGTLLLTVPAHPFMWTGHDVVLGHARRYTMDSFRALLATAPDIEIENVSYMNCAAFPAAAIQRWRRARREKAAGGPSLASDTADVPPAVVNELAFGLFAAERWALPHFSLPFGVSIVAVLKRKTRKSSGEDMEAHGEPLPWAWMAALLALLVACAPKLTGTWLAGHEGPAYLFRTSEFFGLLSSGVWYPRWCVDWYWGYGYPFFVFYSPAFFYAASLFKFFGAATDIAALWASALGNLIFFAGSYRLASRFTRRRSVALVASLFSLLATYRFVQNYVRTDYAEAFGTVFIPWMIAEGVTLCRRSDTRAMARLALFLAAVFFSHTISAVIASATLGLMGIWMLVRANPRAFLRIGLASGLGLCVAAIYWVPAFAEQKFVSTDKLIEKTSAFNYDYADHFVYPWQRWGLSYYYGDSVPGDTDRLSFASSGAFWLLMLAGLALLAKDPVWRKRTLPLWAGWLAVNIMMMPPAKPLWDILPLIRFFQFPWRFLLLDSVLAAPLCAAILDGLHGRKSGRGEYVGIAVILTVLFAVQFHAVIQETFWQAYVGDTRQHSKIGWYWPLVLTAVTAAGLALFALLSKYAGSHERLALVAVVAFALPLSLSSLLRAAYNPMEINPDLREAIENPFAQQRYGIVLPHNRVIPVTTAAQDEYRPKTARVSENKPPDAPARYLEGEGQIALKGQYGTRRVFAANAAGPSTVEIAYFNYPGVAASVNGVRQEPGMSPDGLVSVKIEPGAATIEVWYEGSPVQSAAAWVSFAGLLMVLLLPSFRPLQAWLGEPVPELV